MKASSILTLAVTSLLTSCITDLRPISPTSTAPRTLVIERPYTRHRLATANFPAGRYPAQFVDSSGTYYVSPTKILSNVYGLIDGGFYVPFKTPSAVSAYLINDDNENNIHTPVKLVNGVPGLAYHFEH